MKSLLTFSVCNDQSVSLLRTRSESIWKALLSIGYVMLVGILFSQPARATDINIPAGSTESAIQNAIITVSQSGGGNVNLPAGTFIISNGIAMYSNVALNGVGSATILQAPSTPSGVALITYAYEGVTNISVNNMVLDGHIPRSADYYVDGSPAPFGASGIYIFSYNSPNTHITFSNLEVKNTSHGALIGGSNFITVTHCNFHDNGEGFSHNIYFRACAYVTVDHTKVDYSTIGDGIHFAGGGGQFTINKCQFVGNQGLGLLVQDAPSGLTITNSIIQSSGNTGLDTDATGTNLSQDRWEYNDGYGVQVDDPSSGIMYYNYFVGNATDLFFNYDLAVGPFNTSYAGNVYEAEAADGITGPADTGDWITTYSGFSGLGAVDFNTNHSTNGTLTWPAVTAPTATSYPLVFGYSNGLSTTTSLALSINGTSAGTISFPPTGSWSTWSTVTVNANLLGQGNAVTLSVVPGTSAPLIDNMTVTASTPAAPPAPTGVTAIAVSSQQINLSWNPVPGCYYQVQRVYPQGNLEVIANHITGTTYSDAHLLYGGTTYTYVVIAVNAGGSGSSGNVSATTLIGAPAWAIATGQTKQVALQVLATQGAATYNVKRSTTSGGPYTTIGNFPNTGNLGGYTVYSNYTDTNVTVGVKYYYIFTGVNGSSESGPSPEVSAVPMAVVAPNANSSSVNTTINTAVAVPLSASDPNNPAQPLTYTVTTAPVHGTLSGTAPNLTYTPASGYYGSDGFAFKVNNGVYDSSIATVSISIDPTNLTNGSFETPSLGAGGFANNPTGAGWTFTGTSGIQANGNSVFNPPSAPDGTQTGWVGSYNGALGSISQSVTFPTAGKYTMSFQAAYYGNGGGSQPLQFSVDGVNVGATLTPASASSYGLLKTPVFTIGSAGAHTIALASTVNSGTSISMVDLVSFGYIAPPVASNQSLSTALNTAATVTLSGTDANFPALPLTYTVTTAPAHGTLSGTAPNLTYTPTSGYIGSDSIQFKVNNGQYDSTIATVTITVIGKPTANAQSVSTPVSTATAITLTGSDPDSPALPLTYTITTAPAHGTLSGTAPNLTYTPTTGYVGSDSFQFKVNNGTLDSAIATVTITVIGKPTANAQNVSTPLNTAKAITLTGTDPDSPALPLTYTVTTAPAHGTLSGTAPNLTYTPTTGYVGNDSFQFKVNNGTLDSTIAMVTVTVIGKPTANAQSVSTPVSTAKAITLTGTDPDSPALPLTYTVTTSPAHGTLSGTAPNLTYTPTTGYVGSDSLQFKVNNGTLDSAIATVTITVIGKPTANAQNVSTPLNTAKGVTLTGSDPDSPALPLTYTVTTAPAHGTLSGTAPNLTYTPTSGYVGSDSFQFKVNNGTLDSAIATVTITVTGTAIINGSFETPSEGSGAFVFNPSGATWSFSGDSGIQSNGSLLAAANAPDGTQTGFVESYPNSTTGSISQSVTFSATGTYTISFQAASAPGSGAAAEPLQLKVDGVAVGSPLTPASSNFGSLTTAAFVISTTGAHTITFSGTNASGFYVTLVDSVTLNKVTVTAPAITNSSFETPSEGAAAYKFNPTGATWTFTGDSGIQSNGSLVNPANAPNGTQTGFVETYPNSTTGAMSQSVTFPTPGIYTLSFQAASATNSGGAAEPLQLSVDGVNVGSALTPSSNSFSALTSASFVVSTSGAHTITLTGTNSSGFYVTLIDQVTLTAAP